MQDSEILKIFYEEFIPEVINKCVIIDDWQYHFGLNVCIENKLLSKNNLITLNIHNVAKFDCLLIVYVRKMLLYINKKTEFKRYDNLYFNEIKFTIKAIITYLWSNAAIEDFNEPETFLSKRIELLEKSIFFEDETIFVHKLEDRIPEFSKFPNLTLQNQVMSSDPLAENFLTFCSFLTFNDQVYSLPKIVFGIIGNTCYINCVQKNEEERSKFHKDLERVFYKLKKDEFNNLSSTKLVAITLFLNYLQRKDINKIVFQPYFPVRMQLKEYKVYEKSKLTEEYYFNILKRMVDDEFMLFVSIANYFNKSLNILRYPMQSDSNLTLELIPYKVEPNGLLEKLFWLDSDSLKLK